MSNPHCGYVIAVSGRGVVAWMVRGDRVCRGIMRLILFFPNSVPLLPNFLSKLYSPTIFNRAMLFEFFTLTSLLYLIEEEIYKKVCIFIN